MPLTIMLHRWKELRTNRIKEVTLIYGEISLKVEICKPEKVFRRMKRRK